MIVIISLLAHPLMHGYDINRLPLLVKFNGEKILNVAELKQKVDAVRTLLVRLSVRIRHLSFGLLLGGSYCMPTKAGKLDFGE